ncbi:hypothetical protein LY78DRAFT_383934 [Colletotrichum sublineola]|nr:hypothetical protein LY78DRAFT_383934 [Colletotrichum sublineola]
MQLHSPTGHLEWVILCTVYSTMTFWFPMASVPVLFKIPRPKKRDGHNGRGKLATKWVSPQGRTRRGYDGASIELRHDLKQVLAMVYKSGSSHL